VAEPQIKMAIKVKVAHAFQRGFKLLLNSRWLMAINNAKTGTPKKTKMLVSANAETAVGPAKK